MIRHILFWKLQEEYREGEKRREAEARLAASVETLAPIPGLHNAKTWTTRTRSRPSATIRFTSRTASAARRSSPDASPEILRSEAVEKLRFPTICVLTSAEHGRPKVPMRRLSPS